MKFNRGWSALTRFALFLFAIPTWSVLHPGMARAQAPAVPPEYQDLYTSLNGYLTAFNATLSSMGNGTAYPVLMTGTLTIADSNAGTKLANPGYMTGVRLQLQALQAMGVQAVLVEVGFPVLYQPFLESQGQNYQDFVTFYQQVAAAVRAMGMKLVVENNCLLSNHVQAGWNAAPYYATLDWNSYQAARAQMAVTVAETMQPDYLVVLEEPDTEAAQAGQANANTVSGSTSMLSQILTSLQQNPVAGVQVGAGVGSWLAGYLGFIQSYVTLPVDFIDMHIYPVNTTAGNNNYLTDALTIASTAAAAGKPVTMTESWLNKVRTSELHAISANILDARNVYSFWEPLDAQFFQLMESLANYTQMTFMTFTNSNYLWAYQTYDDTTSAESPSELLDTANALGAQANQQAVYGSLGMSWYAAIVTTPDTTPPTSVTNLAGASGQPTQASLTWSASTDNVGVAGYYVFRNGVQVGTTGELLFQDPGLSEATTYTYTVEAFDLGGNVSTPSLPVNVTTSDVTPPNAPASVVATATSTSQVSVTWSASGDNAHVGSYLVFEGILPTALSQVGLTPGSITSYTAVSLEASTTYYFAVEAVDTSGNISAMSPIASATLLALPSAPTSLAASSASPKQVSLSWSSAPSGMPILSYQVFRGTSSGALAQLSTTANTSYTDLNVSASTTYYYAVEELNTAGNASPMSNMASATTLALPSAPTSLAAAAVSVKKISLSWTAGPAGMSITGYYVFRGTSPGSLTQLASSSATTYNDVTGSPATTYYYAVEEVDSGGDISPLSNTASATTLALPSAPTNLVATAVSSTQIGLNWTPGPAGLTIKTYNVFRGTSPSTLAKLGASAATSYTDRNLTPGTTYYYAVEEVDSSGNVSPMSATASATTQGGPSAPANLAATATSAKQITLSWTAGASGLSIASYTVFRGTSPTAMTQVGTAATISYTDTGLTCSTTYYYGVEEVDSGGNVSPMSATASATTLAGPSAPTILSLTVASTKLINLAWTAGASGLTVTSYYVFRGASPTGLAQVATTKGTTYTDNTLSPSTTYYYGVEEVDSSGNVSPMSAIASGTTLALPLAPTNVAATATSTKQIGLTWVAGPSGLSVKSYAVFRGTSPSSLAQIGNSTVISYTDNTLSPSTTYYYGVEEVDSGGNVSPMSAIASAITLGGPSAPTNLVATASSTKQIKLTWTAGASSLSIKSYYVFRGASASTLAKLATTTAASYTDNNLTPSTAYYYGVEEVDSGGNVSPMSAGASATTLALPSAPTNLAATATSIKQIKLTWTAGPAGMTVRSYYVFRGASPSSLAQIGTTTSTSYTDNTLCASTTYYYGVEEVDSGGNVSPMSVTAPATTLALPAQPTNVTATAISSKQVLASWTETVPGNAMPISSYHIYRGGTAANLAQVATRTSTSYTDTAVTAQTTYYYAVQAVDTGGNLSPMSAVVSATTP